jgi:hypothetical protein
MANKSKSKSKSTAALMRQSEAVYSHLSPRNSRSLGSTLNHDHPTIPSSTFRTLEQSISRSQLRTVEVYKGYNPRTGKSKYVNEPVDLLAHAQDSITRARFKPVTDGIRQRYQRKESVMGSGDNRQPECYPCVPTPLGGMLSGNRGRKERY